MKTPASTIVRSCLLAALLAFGPSLAVAAPSPQSQDEQPRFRIGLFWEGFRINDKNISDFYGHVQKNLPGIEASVHTVHNLDAWAAYRAYTDEAKTTFYGFTSAFRMDMFSLGMIYRYPVSLFEPFIGVGFDFYAYSEKIEGTNDLAGANGSALGFHGQLGSYINIVKFLAAKLYFRLSVVNEGLDNPLPDDATRLNLGGKEFGFSLVARF